MKLLENKIFESADYTLVLSNCLNWSKPQEDRIEAIISMNRLSQKFFDDNYIHKIINSIVSLLYPNYRDGAQGTYTTLQISILNNRLVPYKNKRYDAEKIINGEDRTLFAYVYPLSPTISGDNKRFLSLDVRFEFFTAQGNIGNARIQIHPK